MIKKSLFITFLLVHSWLFAQLNSVELVWQDVRSELVGSDSVRLLGFDDATYDAGRGMLPLYYKSFPLDGDHWLTSDFSVDIQNMEWQTLDFKQAFEGASLITDEVEVDYQVICSRKKYTLAVWVTPLRKTGETSFEKLERFDLNITHLSSPRKKGLTLTSGFVQESALSTGKWVKISIEKTGLYKLTYEDLEGMGLNPKKFGLFGYGGPMLEAKYVNRKFDDLVENALYYHDGNDGKMDPGDYVLFYGHGPLNWSYNASSKEFEHQIHQFSDKAYYFLSSDKGVGLRMNVAQEPFASATHTVTSYTDYGVFEPEVTNLLKSGSEWYSAPILGGGSAQHEFDFKDILTEEDVKLSFSVASRSVAAKATVKFLLNGQEVGSTSLNQSSTGNTGIYAQTKKEVMLEKSASPKINMGISFVSNESTASAWIDFLKVSVRRHLALDGAYTLFRDETTVGSGNIVLFEVESAVSEALVMDVSNRTSPVLMNTTKGTNKISFKASATNVQQYVVVDPEGSFQKPTVLGAVENQNLHGLSQTDMVIISHPDYLTASEDLAATHRLEGLTVHVVTPQQIYNEYSSGQMDLTAFRWFLKMFYDRAASEDDMVKYLLLMGDGSYDNRGVLDDKFNKIPTYQSVNSLNMSSTYVSDDYFAMLDDNEGEMGSGDLVDLGVGRLPVSTVQQATDVVNKIKYYCENRKRSSWKNSVCFVGDDEDNNTHMRDANLLADKVMREHPEMVVNKILLDAYQQTAESSGHRYPEAEEAVEKNINQGVLLWNYSGHGGEAGLTGEQIMNKRKIENYDNLSTLPVWVTATCEFSRFDLFTETTAGELVLLSPKGGGVSLFTTTRIVYSSSNYKINKNFFDYVFAKDENGKPNRLGDVCRLTKEATGTGVNKRKFLLLGDPALQLDYPLLNVKTTHINNLDVTLGINDTISAFETLTVKGFIETEEGDTVKDFNGSVFPQVYDKKVKVTTLMNDKNEYSSSLEFEMWRDIVYTGKTDVVDGQFEFSFKVPKEINYEFGEGRIVYYATSNTAEANGFFEDFVLGGFSDDVTEDNDGPQVSLFMNTPSFVNGQSVNASPLLVAELLDENGISTAGSGIGHDIVAILDDDPNTMEVLNSYYQAVEGNTEGVVKFKFSDLTEGEHTLFFRVWDIYNNSSTQTITFFVENNEKPDIASLYCYPNPAKDKVEFVFSHDRPESVLDIQIEIFNLRGQKVAVMDAYSYSGSNSIDPITWDLTGGNGLKVRPGLYLYRAIITVDGKASVGKTEKLIVM